MIPSVCHELLAGDSALNTLGITADRIKERQSVDIRPFDSGHFIVVSADEQLYVPSINRGPRTLTVWVHTPWDRSRNYREIDRILNRIDDIYSGVTHAVGSDDVRVTMIRKTGRSGNLRDEGWKTIARNATYGVLYDEAAV
ncbi:hypothetical protein AFM11_33455 [Mycolicibacterium wolinskyi]|uniref:DUF3168 domain-containing protein n=1 Tax=Mycolicibacterium wolinskyi TaxID=59750 RepID=A0A132PC42_9MYCO|nr:hypothetical protein [Mycolicibacterium wolinskyi]KWX19888.1 hypothetical protein AFM11_33455 [Mycolicibacterium wolinskyi]